MRRSKVFEMHYVTWFAICAGFVVHTVMANFSSRGPDLFGYLSAEDEISVYEAGTDCRCSQMCLARPACASVSYTPLTGACHLYGRVATRGGLLPDQERTYHFLRGRSGHREYCAADSDCQLEGDRCLGYTCLQGEHLTCRRLLEEFGVSVSGVHWGAVSGITMPLYCDMGYQGGGWTLLLAGGGAVWNATSTLWRPDDANTPSLARPYSIYREADLIALSGSSGNGTVADEFYEIDVYDVATVSGGTWRVPRTESLLGSSISTHTLTLEAGRQYGGWKLRVDPVVPYLASSFDPETFISVSQTPDKVPAEGVLLGARPGAQKWGGLASSGYVAILIRE